MPAQLPGRTPVRPRLRMLGHGARAGSERRGRPGAKPAKNGTGGLPRPTREVGVRVMRTPRRAVD